MSLCNLFISILNIKSRFYCRIVNNIYVEQALFFEPCLLLNVSVKHVLTIA